VYSYKLKIDNFFTHNLYFKEGSRSEITDFQLEDPDRSQLISDQKHSFNAYGKFEKKNVHKFEKELDPKSSEKSDPYP